MRENTGSFIGPVDQARLTRLIDPSGWLSTTSDLKGLGLDGRLKTWRSQMMSIDDTFDSAFRQIQDQMAGLPVIFQAALRDRLEAKFRDITAQLADARQKAVEAIDKQAQLAAPEQLDKLFDRSQLLQAVR